MEQVQGALHIVLKCMITNLLWHCTKWGGSAKGDVEHSKRNSSSESWLSENASSLQKKLLLSKKVIKMVGQGKKEGTSSSTQDWWKFQGPERSNPWSSAGANRLKLPRLLSNHVWITIIFHCSFANYIKYLFPNKITHHQIWIKIVLCDNWNSIFITIASPEKKKSTHQFFYQIGLWHDRLFSLSCRLN